jgi:hypothetical protein
VVEVVPVDPLGLGTPGRLAGQAPDVVAVLFVLVVLVVIVERVLFLVGDVGGGSVAQLVDRVVECLELQPEALGQCLESSDVFDGEDVVPVRGDGLHE